MWVIRATKKIFGVEKDIYLTKPGEWTEDFEECQKYETEQDANHCRMMCHKFFTSIEVLKVD